MGTPQKESFDAGKKYKGVLWIAGRDAQDWGLNEMQAILDAERQRLGGSVFKDGGIVRGLVPSFPAAGQIVLAEGAVHLFGRVEPLDGATLTYPTGTTTAPVTPSSISVPIGVNPTTLGFPTSGTAFLVAPPAAGAADAFAYTGVDATGFTGVTGIGATWPSGSRAVAAQVGTVWARWLLDQVTVAEDASLVSPATGEVVEERIRARTTLVAGTPDVLAERFEDFDAGVPRNWGVSGGTSAKGFPAKFGEAAVRLVHTTGNETRLERELTLKPNTAYQVYFWARTVDGKTDLSLANGAFADLQRVSPAWNPADFLFATSKTYVRKAFSVTADVNAAPVTFRVVLPASAPSTELLIDAVLVTTEALGALDLDRHHVALLFWDRATDTVARAVPRAANLRLADLEPPLDGRDIIGIDENQGLQDFLAALTFDEHGHYRIPPGLLVERDTSRDTGSQLGLLVSAGRAYVRGYRVDKPTGTPVLVGKATTTAHVAAEGRAYAVGTFLYALNKAVGLDDFPIQQITALTAEVTEVLAITRGGTAGTADALGVTNVTTILAATGGTSAGSAAASIAGTAAGPFAFTEANNVLKVKVSEYGGTAGAFQTLTFARGSYTLTEALEALKHGTGRAYRSGKVVGNVAFEDDGTGKLRIKTQTKSGSSTVAVDVDASSTANPVFGFATGQSGTGLGAHWTPTTQYVRTGNSIDWSPTPNVPGIDEPAAGLSYTVVVRRTKTLGLTTDYRLGGVFASQVDRFYKVAAWGPNGEGLPSAAVNRVTPAGSINKLTWTTVANAVSYHVYRSSDGGATYAFLKNVTSAVAVDDGSLTPDASLATPAFPSTTSGRASTQLAAAAAAGAISITVDSTVGFPTSGTIFLGGSDHVTYTGTTATTFTGIPASGAGSIGQAHAVGAQATQGPAMGAPTLGEDELGAVNFSPQGDKPTDGTSFNVDYDYFQPRIDLVAIDRAGTVAVVKGVPADRPLPPPQPADVMLLAQVEASANSTQLEIGNAERTERPTVADLRLLAERVEALFVNDVNQAILNQIAGRVASPKGLFADGMADATQHDRGHALYDAFLDEILQYTTLPHDDERVAPAVNAVPTTAVARNQIYALPSSELVLVDQPQWSEEMLVNPFSAFAAPPPKVRLTPDSVTWTLSTKALAKAERQTALALAALAQGAQIVNIRFKEKHPPWITVTLETLLQDAQGRIRVIRQKFSFPAIIVRADGAHFAANENNVAGAFAGVGVTLTPVAPTTAGTSPGTVKADAVGRWAASFLMPATVSIGTHDFVATGPTSGEARAAFTGFSSVFPVPPRPRASLVDPVAQSFGFESSPKTVSAVGLWFTAKDAALPVTVELRTLVAGFPSRELLAEKTLAPAEVSTTGETKVEFDQYVHVPAGLTLVVGIFSSSNVYKVQTATLGKLGKNPSEWIAVNPYARGVLFSSSNGESWSVHQASDLRFKIYGRTFTSPAVLEFSPVTPGLTPANYSDLFLAADQFVPQGSTVTWEYELSGDGIPRPFAPFARRRLEVLAASVILRARLSTTNPDVSPTVGLPTVALDGMLNALAGKYVTRMVEFTQALVSSRIYAAAAIPSGTTVNWFASNDDGATWNAASVVGAPVALDAEWSEYTLSATFTAGTEKRLRLRADLGTANRLVLPRIGRVGATVE